MPRCQISIHYRTWPCSACGQPMDPAHITTIDGQDVAVCAGCCPAKHRTTRFSTTNEAPNATACEVSAPGADCPSETFQERSRERSQK